MFVVRIVCFCFSICISTLTVAQSMPQGTLEKLTNLFRMMTCVQANDSLKNGRWIAHHWHLNVYDKQSYVQYGSTLGKQLQCGVIHTNKTLPKQHYFITLFKELSKVIALIGQDIPVEELPESAFFKGEALLNQATFNFEVKAPALSKQTKSLIIQQDTQVQTYIRYVLTDADYQNDNELSSMLNQGQIFDQANKNTDTNNVLSSYTNLDTPPDNNIQAEALAATNNDIELENMKTTAEGHASISHSITPEKGSQKPVTFPQAMDKLTHHTMSGTKESSQDSITNLEQTLLQTQQVIYDRTLNE